MKLRSASRKAYTSGSLIEPSAAATKPAAKRQFTAGYGRKSFKTDAERVAFLFELYQRYTLLLPTEPAKRARRVKPSPQGA